MYIVTPKVADFGLSRQLENSTYYQANMGKFPVKVSTPIEYYFWFCLVDRSWSPQIPKIQYEGTKYYIKFNPINKSDIWSFGIVLYEIITYGLEPYMGMVSNMSLCNF